MPPGGSAHWSVWIGPRVFANSGAEANVGAIKLARKWGSVKRSSAYEIVVFDGAFHGHTLATMSASGTPQWKDLFEPKVPGFIRVQPEDLTAVRKAIGPKTAAVMLEPIQANREFSSHTGSKKDSPAISTRV